MTTALTYLRWQSPGSKPAEALARSAAEGGGVLTMNGQHGDDRTKTIASVECALTVANPLLSIRVYGQIFGVDLATLKRRLNEASDAEDAAKTLIEEGWGSYVAVIEQPNDSFVLRDPSGTMPLYIAGSPDLDVASTGFTPGLLTAGGIEKAVNAESILELALNPPAASYVSALKAVTIVAPGHLCRLRARGDEIPIWRPGDFARCRSELSSTGLRAAVDEVLRQLAGRHRLGIELSGGLDSSIVFSSLAHLGISARPFNLATTSAGGDEARFAMDVAERWGSELSAISAAGELPDYSAFDRHRHGVQPPLHGLDSVFATARRILIDGDKIDAVMTGQGGDALFFRMPTRLTARDRRIDRGLRSVISAATVDDARRVRGSIWSVIPTAFGWRHKADREDQEWLTSRMLGSGVRDAAGNRPIEHPWLTGTADLPPAKRLHLGLLSNCQLFHGPRLFAPDVPVVHPLLSQPLMELALACPTYALQRGGLDRALAREAFSDRLPRSVLDRRGKGEASDHYSRAILQNRQWLLEHLLDGQLVALGVLSRDALEAALQPNALRLGTDYRAFVQYASIESWLRYWSRS